MPPSSPYRDLLLKLSRREYRVEAGGVSTSVVEYGPADAPPLVLVHGFRGDHHGLEPIAAYLPDVRSIIPDLPGFGASGELPTGSIGEYAAWLIDLVGQLSPGEAVLGHSFGSVVVAHAAAGGMSASRIILVNPIATPALEGGSRLGSLAARAYYAAAAAAPERVGLALLGAKPIVRGMSAAMSKTRDKELRRWIHYQHDRYFSNYASRDAVLGAFDTSIRHTAGEVAGKVRAPVQLIAADRDDITPLEHQRQLQARFPNAGLEVLTGVGHLVHYEQPRQAADIIRRVLDLPVPDTAAG